MCTVTYIPLKNSVLFSSNRDENPARKNALPPSVYRSGDKTILYPADGLAGGTWIALNTHGDLIILLNGGFANHTRKNKYRQSRGILVRQMIASGSLIDFWNNTSMHDIEPFTLVVYAKQTLHQLVWTGNEKYHLLPDICQPHIWSSATLYDVVARQQREKVFRDYVNERGINTKSQLVEFLKTAMATDFHNGFVMNRNNLVSTCSISTVELQRDYFDFEYYDLLNNSTHSVGLMPDTGKIFNTKMALNS
jgi:uncharacterized protein with NRDE domain